jgi:hypothetical protein
MSAARDCWDGYLLWLLDAAMKELAIAQDAQTPAGRREAALLMAASHIGMAKLVLHERERSSEEGRTPAKTGEKRE